MNCAIHTQAAAAAYCRTCGKALCEECKRDVRGVIYCEDCIVSGLQHALPGAPASPSAALGAGPNPTAAAFLGMIPGVGAAYNGQFTKAFVHVVVFAMLIVVEHDESALTGAAHGLIILAFVAYQVIDAYRTARAKQLGQPAPDDVLGLSQGLWSPGGKLAEVPIGAAVLILLGVAFLLRNMGILHFGSIGKLWPLVLIFIGIRMFQRRGFWKS